MNKYSRFKKIMGFMSIITLVVLSVFEKELLQPKYYYYSATIGVVVIIIALISVILYNIEKNKNKRKE